MAFLFFPFFSAVIFLQSGVKNPINYEMHLLGSTNRGNHNILRGSATTQNANHGSTRVNSENTRMQQTEPGAAASILFPHACTRVGIATW